MRRGERRAAREVASFLEEWAEYAAAGLVRREYDPGENEGVAEFFEASGDVEFGRRWRRRHSDAGVYLRRTAELREPTRDFLDRVEAIRSAVDEDGRWERTDEWRISTVGTDRLERVGDHYRATAEYHGGFTADFRTFAEAYEAMRVLAAIQRDLFYAVGWSSWADQGQMEPTDPPRARTAVEARYRYLARLSDEARAESTELTSQLASTLARTGDWRDETRGETVPARRSARSVESPPLPGEEEAGSLRVIELSVACRSLTMTTEAPTVERAAEFIGIFTQLQLDLAEILEWDWV
jgi:hypothetical protein